MLYDCTATPRSPRLAPFHPNLEAEILSTLLCHGASSSLPSVPYSPEYAYPYHECLVSMSHTHGIGHAGGEAITDALRSLPDLSPDFEVVGLALSVFAGSGEACEQGGRHHGHAARQVHGTPLPGHAPKGAESVRESQRQDSCGKIVSHAQRDDCVPAGMHVETDSHVAHVGRGTKDHVYGSRKCALRHVQIKQHRLRGDDLGGIGLGGRTCMEPSFGGSACGPAGRGLDGGDYGDQGCMDMVIDERTDSEAGVHSERFDQDLGTLGSMAVDTLGERRTGDVICGAAGSRDRDQDQGYVGNGLAHVGGTRLSHGANDGMQVAAGALSRREHEDEDGCAGSPMEVDVSRHPEACSSVGTAMRGDGGASAGLAADGIKQHSGCGCTSAECGTGQSSSAVATGGNGRCRCGDALAAVCEQASENRGSGGPSGGSRNTRTSGAGAAGARLDAQAAAPAQKPGTSNARSLVTVADGSDTVTASSMRFSGSRSLDGRNAGAAVGSAIAPYRTQAASSNSERSPRFRYADEEDEHALYGQDLSACASAMSNSAVIRRFLEEHCERRLSFAMGLHDRLGSNSPVHALIDELAKDICWSRGSCKTRDR